MLNPTIKILVPLDLNKMAKIMIVFKKMAYNNKFVRNNNNKKIIVNR